MRMTCCVAKRSSSRRARSTRFAAEQGRRGDGFSGFILGKAGPRGTRCRAREFVYGGRQRTRGRVGTAPGGLAPAGDRKRNARFEPAQRVFIRSSFAGQQGGYQKSGRVVVECAGVGRADAKPRGKTSPDENSLCADAALEEGHREAAR